MLETDLPTNDDATNADQPQPPVEPPAEVIRPTARDVQRTALNDLLHLSRETSATEAEIEAKHREALEKTKATFERTTRDYDYRLETLRKQIEEKAAEKAQQIAAQYQQQLARLKEQLTDKKSKITLDFDNAKQDLKKKFDHAAWLADSVLEAAEQQAQAEFRKDVDRHNDQMENLSAAEKVAATVVQTYGVMPEPLPAPQLDPASIEANAEAVLQQKQEEIDALMAKLRKFGWAKFTVGAWPIVVSVFLIAAGAAAVQLTIAPTPLEPKLPEIAYGAGGGLVLAIILLGVIKVAGGSAVRKVYGPLRQTLADTQVASTVVNQNAAKRRDEAIKRATTQRNEEVDAARQKLAPLQQKAIATRDAALRKLQEEKDQALARVNAAKEKSEAELAAWKKKQQEDSVGRVQAEQQRLKQQYELDLKALETRYNERHKSLQDRWRDGLKAIQAPIHTGTEGKGLRADWPAIERAYSTGPKEFPETIPFGQLTIDMNQISAGIPKDDTVALPEKFEVPAMIAFPRQASVLIQTDPEGRDDGLRAMQMLMARLIAHLPPGRARFTIIDPVGLGQSFAGFMHLADHDDQLVNTRIWTTPEQIEQRLTDLTEHMETVIQKYLRNEFATIDEYNAQAGELAEPYRFLVVADFPSGFEGESWRRLLSIARSGARCGVYLLVLRDVRQSLPPDLMVEDLEAACTNLVRENGRFVWRDEIYQQFPLTLDPPPDEDTLTKLVHKVGRAAKEAARVEVDFATIAPKESEFWTASAASELAVPIGRMGATRLQYFRCGRGMAQHSLVAGKTGSGKSTLLHAMVTNMAMWYSPDEVEFYLIDFKKGVEFKTYADYQLPHARAIAVESDREFGLSVLQRIDAELVRRGELFRKAGVQNLSDYRKTEGAQVMPRVMLIIDEFQEFFTEDDKLAQDAQLLLDRLVRQGRAFGIHVFLGSQTIGGSGGLARTTISQMGIRIALQCNEADSQLILGDNNSAARLLTRPGEAIYNDQGGLVESNSPFQVAWLSDERREKYLALVNDKLKKEGTKRPVIPPLVFEGNAPADITKNHRLAAALRGDAPTVPVAWIGDPVAIKDPTSIAFRRQSGSNVLIIGQQDEQALSTLAACMISLAAQLPPDRGSFVLLDGTPNDSFLYGQLQKAIEGLPNEIKHIDYRGVDDAINELTEELNRRREDDSGNHPGLFLVINGLQRYRMLRKSDDDGGGFSFSLSNDDDTPKKASPAKQLVDLIKEGPNVGIHVIAWCDTLASIERTFERGIMREFDNRVLFQMSANDSSNLIDSPAANRLGFNRGLSYSEEQGVMEKFRPYGLPPKEWLEELAGKLKTRA